MSEIFKFFTPFTYWVLILLWGAILVFYLRKLRALPTRHLYFTLIFILAIDALRTLIESLYFGAWYTSLAGLLPGYIAEELTRPEMVIIPKIMNVIAAVLVMVLLLKRWLPQEEREKNRLEEAFRTSEEKFSAFTNQSFECISAADEQGHYTYVNPAFCSMVGYSREELLKMSVFDLRSPLQKESIFEESKNTYDSEPIRVWLRRKDGTDFPAEVLGKVIEYGGKKSVLGVVRDIAERLRDEEEKHSFEIGLLHAQKLESLGILAGGIAHDFNNLLTVILGNANLSREILGKDSPAEEYLKSIERSADRAANLAQEMLAYSGKGKFVIETVDPVNLVKDMAGLLEVSFPKNVEIHFAFDEGTFPIEGDTNQLRQVVMNLITNAAEAIGDLPGFIHMRTGSKQCSENFLREASPAQYPLNGDPLPPGLYSWLEVEDTGCGMTPETLDKIFDPFFTTKFTGRGLGMSAVIGIIRGHKGTLRIKSTPGKGTIFTVYFPAKGPVFEAGPKASPSVDTGQQVPKHSAVKPPEKGQKKRRKMTPTLGTILLTDDDESVRTVGERVLHRLGFKVYTAENGVQACSIYEKYGTEIDCVILDLTMPRMGGPEALAKIREIDPKAKILFSSGFNEEMAEGAGGQKADGFLQKPYLKKDLETILARILDPKGPRG